DQEALTAYQTAMSGGLWIPGAIERYADLLARTGDRDAARQLLAHDMSTQNPGLAAALQRLDAGEAVAAQPFTPARGAAIGLNGLSAIYLQESDSAHGLSALTLALMLDPEFDAARIAFAQQQVRLGHTQAARAMLARVPADSPYAANARMIEAWAVLDGGNEAEALAIAAAAAASGDVRAKR